MSGPCREIEPLLAEAAAGPLAPADAQRLEDHLAACARCRREAIAYREALGLARLPAAEPHAGDLATATLVAYHGRRRRRITALTIGAGMAAAVAAALVVLTPALITLRTLPARHAAVDPGGAATQVSGAVGTAGAASAVVSDDLGADDAALAALDEVEAL